MFARIALLALLSLSACDDYDEVQRADDIATYEAWLKENPSHSKVFVANIRLEELYLEKARQEKTLAAWDAYLERWPKGRHHDKALEERESHLYDWAFQEGTKAAWQKWIDQYPKGFSKHRGVAKASLAATTYAEKMTITEIKTRKVNLAEDPEGPLDGTEFAVEITNNGDDTLEAFVLRIHYLDAKGKSLGNRVWPLVGTSRDFKVPVEEEKKVPMKPGETRTWAWWTGDLPDGFSKAVVHPARVRPVREEG
jgi:hypothetical protein